MRFHVRVSRRCFTPAVFWRTAMITPGMDVSTRNSYLHVMDDSGDVIRHGRGRNTTTDPGQR